MLNTELQPWYKTYTINPKFEQIYKFNISSVCKHTKKLSLFNSSVRQTSTDDIMQKFLPPCWPISKSTYSYMFRQRIMRSTLVCVYYILGNTQINLRMYAQTYKFSTHCLPCFLDFWPILLTWDNFLFECGWSFYVTCKGLRISLTWFSQLLPKLLTISSPLKLTLKLWCSTEGMERKLAINALSVQWRPLVASSESATTSATS